jgi:hypothetical protein
LADRPETLDQFQPQASVFCAVPASNLRPQHDPCRNLQSRSWVSNSECTPMGARAASITACRLPST